MTQRKTSRTGVSLLGPLVILTVWVVACSKPNPIYCDMTTQCGDSVRTFCDLSGQLGSPRTCVTPAEAGSVVQRLCRAQADCEGIRPVCDANALVCRGCSNDAECQGVDSARPFCNPLSVCVACRSSSDCKVEAPFCNQGACQSCASNSQCASGICSDGGCIAEADIVYVAQGGCSPTARGERANPRCLPSQALPLLNDGRRFVLIQSGTYRDNVVINDETLRTTSEVTLVGQGNPVLVSAQTGSTEGIPSILQVDEHRSVRVKGMTLTGRMTGGVMPFVAGVTATNAAEVRIEDTQIDSLRIGLFVQASAVVHASSATISQNWMGVVGADNPNMPGAMTLENCIISRNDYGVTITHVRTAIKKSDISENVFSGIVMHTGELTLDASTLRENGRTPPINSESNVGGLKVLDGSLRVTSSLFAKNGSSGPNQAGGVTLSSSTTGTFVNNTVVDSVYMGSAAPELSCSAPFTITNSILWGAARGGDSEGPFVGPCQFEFSNVSRAADVPPGPGNSTFEPVFADPQRGNYHLTHYSGLRDKGTQTGAPPTDLDGEMRPSGAGIDIGADEIR